MRERLVLTLACVAAAWALLAGAAERPPVENREIRIFHVAGAMVETGDFLVPHARGQPRLHKPPLYYCLPLAVWGAAALLASPEQSGHELLDQRVDLVRNLGGREVPRAGEFHVP